MLAAVTPAGEEPHVALAFRTHSSRFPGINKKRLGKFQTVSGSEDIRELRPARINREAESRLLRIASECNERILDR